MTGQLLAISARDLRENDVLVTVEGLPRCGRLTTMPTRQDSSVMLTLTVSRGNDVDVLTVASSARVTAQRI